MIKVKYISFLTIVFISVMFLSSCLETEAERTKEDELSELNAYLSGLISAGYDVDTTALGVYYVVIDEGEGEYPKKGDTLTIGYAGYFIDNSLFDSTVLSGKDSTITFNFIDDPMISGFEDGLKLMNKGSRIQMIIPSEYAYGEQGTLYIPKYATLIFVVKMFDIEPVAASD